MFNLLAVFHTRGWSRSWVLANQGYPVLQTTHLTLGTSLLSPLTSRSWCWGWVGYFGFSRNCWGKRGSKKRLNEMRQLVPRWVTVSSLASVMDTRTEVSHHRIIKEKPLGSVQPFPCAARSSTNPCPQEPRLCGFRSL